MPKVQRIGRKRDNARENSSDVSESVNQYVHDHEKRAYNPPVGLVTPETDKDMPKKKYEYDPHIDPELQWAGKKEHTSFHVDTVSLHVHERIDPLTIIEKVRNKPEYVQQTLSYYFELPENNPPLRDAIDFYKHNQNWSNRLIAGDSLLVMNSLLQKEGMAGKVQTIYIDPPYGISYGSNFQPFVNRRQVRDRKDEDLTQEPEMIKAFRDTWELGIHSYIAYMRDRLLLSYELLNGSGSIFVQISDENVHLVRNLLDEIFGAGNFVSLITFRKKGMPLGAKFLEGVSDYIIWYAKDKNSLKYRQLYEDKKVEGDQHWNFAELPDGSRIRLTTEQINNHKLLPTGADLIQLNGLYPAGIYQNGLFEFSFRGKKYYPPAGCSWKTSKQGMEKLAELNRLEPYANGSTIRYVLKLSDYPVSPITNLWPNTPPPSDKQYVVQTAARVIQNCVLMTTDPGDLVFDPTCGSGTTAYVAEKWGRRWITCDTSRVAIAIAKQRLMTSAYSYYELADQDEGVSGGFHYQTVAHTTLGSIVNSESAPQETLFDRPVIDRKKTRVTGPFTVEAVPAPVVKSLDEMTEANFIDNSLARSGATAKHDLWRSELLATGVLGRGAEKIAFSRVEPLEGTEWLHADAETKEKEPRRVVISFGHDYAPLEQRQVARAIEEAQVLVPKPRIILFVAFQFDPEAAKDIDELKWAGITILRVQMNTDLLTEDLKKRVSRSQSFWLMGQPEIEMRKTKDNKYIVEIHGFDYYNTKNHEIESGNASKIAMWMLDTDYDGRSLYPQQVFFPMSGDAGGWEKVGKSIRAQIDEELLKKYHGTVSLPFEKGLNRRVAVKIIDDRGIESLRILQVK